MGTNVGATAIISVIIGKEKPNATFADLLMRSDILPYSSCE